ncbi:hypothetical protein [uncultured Microscilla sp.]|uniref:hypothetical protein n=1 Tax=uncultured Microscilla sp. TaxID=432653 RepID=UPI00262C70C1|nr:hypothetical protein [uncultured Microscilla sp.]
MKYFFTVLLACTLFGAKGQAHDPEMQKNAVILNSRMTPSSLVRTRVKQKEALKGNPFLFQETKKGAVKIKHHYNKEYAFANMRYDAFNHEIEVVLENKKRYIRGVDLNEFALYHEGKRLLFINANHYSFKSTKLHGFVQLIEDGEVQLVKRVKIDILKSNYNVALNVGNNYDKFIRKTTYFYAHKGVLYQVKSKRDLYRFFSKRNFNAKAVIKQHKIKFRKQKEQAFQLLARTYNAQIIDK